MDTSNLPKQQSKEVNGDGRPVSLPGIYEDKDTDAVFITSEGDEGIAQADAILAVAKQTGMRWERVGDVPSRVALLEMRKAQAVKDATADAIAAGKEAAELKAAKDKALAEAKLELEKA